MRKERHFCKLNNKGASLITVIITIGFIAVLAGTIMMTSLVNFKMKRVNVYAKDTFYSAEQVLDEINIGLQRYVSDSMSAAYMDVMQNYSQYSVEKKRMVMQTNYYENLWEKLEAPGSGHKFYDINVLEGFLKDSTKWPEGAGDDGYGAIVRALKSDGSLAMEGTMETYDTGIVLKGLRVYYKDSKDFVSVIETDIRLTYPELDFAATTALPDIASHVIIADEGMIIDGNGGLAMEGNFYADSISYTGTDQASRKPITHTGDGRIVIKHDLYLKNANFSNEKTGSLWAEGIETNGSTLKLQGETLMADDLNINGNMSDITLSGIYNGFGSSIDDPEKSSAILINGVNSKLDLSGIEKITLAGHAYVAPVGEGESSENVYTGESIAVKSNQLMYLIPPECIGVDNTTGESLYRKNPLTSEEYNNIQDTSRYTEVSLDVEVTKLNGTLTEYITKVNGVAQPEKVFVQTTGGQPLVYYYMKFPDEETANRYFALYYKSNKDTFDNYIKTYVKELKFPTTATVTRIKLAANGVYGDGTEGFTMLPQTVESAATQLADNQQRYQERFTALCTKLTDNFLELTKVHAAAGEDKKVVFDNLVDEDKLKTYIQAGSGTTTLKIQGDFGDVILTTEPEFVLNQEEYANVHLVISTGNVTIDVDKFDGTVFADGTISITGRVQELKTNNEAVGAMLRYYQEMNGQNVMVAQVLRDGTEFVFAIEDAEDTEETIKSLADLIVYENWKKE